MKPSEVQATLLQGFVALVLIELKIHSFIVHPKNKILRPQPAIWQLYYGPEFVSLALDKWAYDNGVVLDFSRPGKPTDNPFIESFNGSFRDECLNVNWFMSLEDARQKIENWRQDNNEFRPHSR